MPELQGQLFGGAPGRKTYTEHGLPITDIPQAKIPGGAAPYPERSTKIGWMQEGAGTRDIMHTEDVGRHRSRPQEEQLKMFMKPHEILEQWGPLDADRETHDFDDIGYTGRSRTTGGGSNQAEHTWDKDLEKYTGQPGGWKSKRTSGGSPVYARSQSDQEDDDQLWDRKYDEAFDEYGSQGIHGGYGEERASRNTLSTRDTQGRRNLTAGRTQVETWSNTLGTHEREEKYYRNAGDSGKFHGESNLGDSIVNHGYQGKPVPLGLERRNVNNQRELVGGHHRMAVMKQHRPDDYVPVEHFRDIFEAKQSKDYT